MFNRSLISLAVALIAAHGSVVAQTERDLDSHEHGAASINLVIDGTTVFVELESPWNNLVGFEHAPSTDAQREAVHDALETLSAPAALFAFNAGAGCEASSADIESSLDSDEHDEHDEHDDHDKDDDHAEHDDHDKDDDHAEHDDHDDHDKDADHAEHDEHDDHDKDDDHAEHDEHDDHDKDDDHAEHDEHDHGESETHSELHAMYSFECQNPDQLQTVDVKLFDLYTGFSEITYQLVGPSGQTGAQLTRSMITLDLTSVR